MNIWIIFTLNYSIALIALDAGAVKNAEEVIPYGGTKKYFKSWEQDMTIVQAIKTSNVAVFHTIAKRLGPDTYREMLSLFDYGGADPGSSLDNRFWLTGPLKISALGPVEFLRRLTAGELEIIKQSYERVRSLIQVESLFARTAPNTIKSPDSIDENMWICLPQHRTGLNKPFNQ